jgi:hypothetical protein
MNSYFGMTFKFPAAWKPLADQKKKELADSGAKQRGRRSAPHHDIQPAHDH